MKKFTIFIVISFVAVLLFFGLYLFKISDEDVYLSLAPNFSSEVVKENGANPKKAVSWVEKIAQKKGENYVLPTNQIFIEIGNLDGNLGLTQLIIDKDDLYSMFCLTQTLKSFNLNFSLVKNDGVNLIYIHSKDRKILENLVKKLKEYDINSNLKEISL